MLNLKEITNGRIEYRRAKTASPISIKVEPEAMKLIEKYRGEKQLLSPLDTYRNYKDFLHRLNDNLKQMIPKLSTYWARHSLATLMAEIDIPKDTIAKVLGHSDRDVTSIYIKFDQRKIDEAMRKVIDYVNEK